MIFDKAESHSAPEMPAFSGQMAGIGASTVT